MNNFPTREEKIAGLEEMVIWAANVIIEGKQLGKPESDLCFFAAMAVRKAETAAKMKAS